MQKAAVDERASSHRPPDPSQIALPTSQALTISAYLTTAAAMTMTTWQ